MIRPENITLGVIAGGQLGKMIIQKASEWSVKTSVLDPDPTCPARAVANRYTAGSYLDFDTVYNFGKTVDLLTFELENVNIQALKKLKSEGVKISPDPEIIECIQDKGTQKKWYQTHNIPTSKVEFFESKEEIIKAIESGKISFPCVQKMRTGGFDGRGVSILHSEEDLESILPEPSIIEEKIEIEKEIAIQVARNENGEIICFPATEMTFNPKENLVDYLICPANISQETEQKAIQLATEIAEKMNLVGILAIEFFLTPSGEILVNEAAPRPHNSGHHTIEGTITSQFEQLLRAIFNFPLGSTEIVRPAVMINIIGEKGHTGPVKYEGFDTLLKESGTYIHIYGKEITKPARKMGHITILGKTVEEALQKAEKLKHSFSSIS